MTTQALDIGPFAGIGLGTEVVRSADALVEADLIDLALRRIVALRIPRFVARADARELAALLRVHPQRGSYEVAPTVGKVGATFFDSNGHPAAREVYHRAAADNTELLRRACGRFGSPVDKLQRQLHEVARPGTTMEQIDGRPMSVGVCRILTAGSVIPPHQDSLAADAVDASSPRELVGQLSVNVYLSVAARGGDLALWRESFDTEQCRRMQRAHGHGFDERWLPRPAAIITPRAGELVALNSRCVHAVGTVTRGERISLASFVGYRGPDQAWSFWS